MQVSARGLKEPTAQLLDLIDQESEHHQAGKDGGQVLLAMTVIVLELIALVFERIESFIFHFPAGTPSSHQGLNIISSHLDIGDPAEQALLIAVDFPVLQEIDLKLGVGLIQG